MPWNKGECGNPKGRPRTNKEFALACKEKSTKALEVLAKVVDGMAGCKVSDRVKAAEIILSYAYGKPRQALELAGENGTPLPTIEVVIKNAP